MSAGQDRYEERRLAEHEAEMARLRMSKASYVSDAEARELFAEFATAMRGFLRGDAAFRFVRIGDATRITFEPARNDGQ